MNCHLSVMDGASTVFLGLDCWQTRGQHMMVMIDGAMRESLGSYHFRMLGIRSAKEWTTREKLIWEEDETLCW